MAKSTQSSRRRFRRIGGGASLCLRYRLPRSAGRLPRAPQLSREARVRLHFLAYAKTHSVAATCDRFGIARSTFYRWQRRYDPNDLRSLEDRPSRPRQPRQPTWTAAQVAAVRRLREERPRWGKDKLRPVLATQGVPLSVSMVGRILADLTRRRVLAEPRVARLRPHARHCRPYAVRKPKDYLVEQPGDLVQVDTMHLSPLPGVERRQFTAVDVVSRSAVVEVRSVATAGTATAFLDVLQARMPFPVTAIQVDGGSEFKAAFETACQDRGLQLFVLPPRSPKLNGKVERLNRTFRAEFWECYGGEVDLPPLQAALRGWETTYNAVRPHQALGYLTPAAYLTTLPSPHL
ncbi:MAG: integrase core domain-containing protein [Chloroflexota bacterium]|nr:integrase core domain-containing protein [Chloroflexota bacterium]